MRSITTDEFARFLKRAKPGARIEYHLGFLAIDREYTVPLGDAMMTLQNTTVNAIGYAAWAAYRAGRVELFQEKLAPGLYSYLAVKKRR